MSLVCHCSFICFICILSVVGAAHAVLTMADGCSSTSSFVSLSVSLPLPMQVLPQVLPEVQPELPEECREPSRHEAFSGEVQVSAGCVCVLTRTTLSWD